MEDCIFCKLKEAHHVLYRDDKCYVLTDQYPASYGHMLVISNEHYENALAAPDSVVADIFLVARRFGRLALERLGASGVNIDTNIGRSAGQAVMHMHIHVVPRYEKMPNGKKYDAHTEITKEEREELLAKLK